MFTRLVMAAILLTVLVTLIKVPKQDRKAYIKRYWPIIALLTLCLLALSKNVSWLAPVVGFVAISCQLGFKYLSVFGSTSNTQKKHSQHKPPIDPSINQAMGLFGFKKKPVNRQSIIEKHRQLIAKHHPDKGGDPAMASDINHARDVLLRLFD